MATLTLTPSQLKGTGSLNIFEITSGTVVTENYYIQTGYMISYTNTTSSNAVTWAEHVSASVSSDTGVLQTNSAGSSTIAQALYNSGRGNPNYNIYRLYHEYSIETGSVSGKTVTSGEFKMSHNAPGTSSINVRFYWGGYNVLGITPAGYNRYIASGSIPITDAVTITGAGETSFPLNATGKLLLNNATSSGYRYTTVLVMEPDYIVTEPAVDSSYSISAPSVALRSASLSYTVQI